MNAPWPAATTGYEKDAARAARRAAIGFRAHSGWAAAVAVVEAGTGRGPRQGGPSAILRRRIEMADRGTPGPSQPYHAAVGLDIREAERHVAHCAARAAALATAAIRGIVEDLRRLGCRTAGCGLLLASGRPLPPLERILASHPLLHTAEGELYREALRAASRECGLPLTTLKERELLERAAAGLHLPAERIERHVAAMGKGIGPPWRQDQKFAAVAAWLALK
ncbi:MAG: hypothetical protein ABSH24_20265 [Bryobacteraceae bacterium]